MSALTSGLYSPGAMQFRSELLAGESLLWLGQPSRRVLFHSRDAFVIPFSLLRGGFAIFWQLGVTGGFGVSSANDPGWLVLWGIPFVLMGQYMIWGRFLWTAWRKGRTHYAVTNRRILVLNTAPSRRLTDRSLRNLDSVSLSTRADGIGTIEFSPTVYAPSSAFGRRNQNQIDINQSSAIFYDVPDAKQVYQLIQQQRDKAHMGAERD